MDDVRDYTIEQNWSDYSAEEHAIWRLLFDRQQHLLVGRACREYLDGLEGLGVAAEGIPDFRRLSDLLDQATGWRIAPVPGIVPDELFFALLARRRFPSTCFIRRRDQPIGRDIFQSRANALGDLFRPLHDLIAEIDHAEHDLLG